MKFMMSFTLSSLLTPPCPQDRATLSGSWRPISLYVQFLTFFKLQLTFHIVLVSGARHLWKADLAVSRPRKLSRTLALSMSGWGAKGPASRQNPGVTALARVRTLRGADPGCHVAHQLLPADPGSRVTCFPGASVRGPPPRVTGWRLTPARLPGPVPLRPQAEPRAHELPRHRALQKDSPQN